MSLSFSISPASEVPIFRQIVQQVHRAVSMGQLAVGEQLPAVRVLAEILVVNPNTVARSYQELIRDGVLESRAGRGVFVTARREVFSREERDRRLKQAAAQLCHEAILLGAELPEVRANIEAAWKLLQRQSHTVETPEERKSHESRDRDRPSDQILRQARDRARSQPGRAWRLHLRFPGAQRYG